MNWKWPGMAGWMVAFCAALGGCARDRVLVVSQPAAAQLPIALSLRCSDTRVRIAFPRGTQTVKPGEFKPDEICYLEGNHCRIDCFTSGSTLDLGAFDSNDLLTDNPMWGIEPADKNALAAQMMKLYGVLFLVAGSVDRLPGTLGEYIQEPGQHLAEVLGLTDALLNQKHVQFKGFAQGGNFTVTIELTDSGREKLTDALDEAGESSGTRRWVHLREHSSKSSTGRILRRLAAPETQSLKKESARPPTAGEPTR